MCQQDFRTGIAWRTTQRLRRIATLRWVKMMCAKVRDSRENQRRTVVSQHYMLIFQHSQAQSEDFLCPSSFAGEILLIAGDEVSPVSRLQAGQGCRMRRQLLYGAVNQVAGYGDHVGF